MDDIDDRVEGRSLSPAVARITEVVTAEPAASLTPERLASVAADSLPHDAACGITVVPEVGPPRTLVATDDVSAEVEAMQYAAGEGPSLTASTTEDVVLVEDVGHERRWPAFVRRCMESTPVRSVLSAPLRLESTDQAAMNFYARGPERLDETDVGVALRVAPLVTLAVRSALDRQKATQLEVALRSSRQIGTAMGILMARELVTSEQAFALLRGASQSLNRKLRDVAAEVETIGRLPQVPRSGRRADARSTSTREGSAAQPTTPPTPKPQKPPKTPEPPETRNGPAS